MAELSLARGFPKAELADWQALVADALKGAPLASLRSSTYDGIVIEPLYARAEDGGVIPGRAPGEPWSVMQRIDLPDPGAASAQTLDDLNNGATGLQLVFEGAVGDCGFALPATAEALKQALDGVHLDWGVQVELDIGRQSKQVPAILAELVELRGIAPSAANIRFGFNPIGAIAMSGAAPRSWLEIAPAFAGLVADLARKGFAGPFAVADGRPINAAGGSEAQELAFVVANALAYLRALEAHGIALDDARRYIYFRLAADQDQFLTIAKFRALRKLWARIEEACGLKPSRAFVAAETSWRMLTKRDAQGNIVRGTIAALAAAVGGADAITVLPYSAALGLPDALARRIARNTQTILIEEANLYRVADPAAGSGAVEALTNALGEHAWALFQEIERAGGAAKALETGLIQRAVAKVRAEREKNVARRKDALIGTSDFADLAEEPMPVLAPSKRDGQTGTEGFEPLPRRRLAEAYEALRERSDAYLAKQGERPKVLLTCLGRASDFTARASFAKSLFEAGGIEAVETANGDVTKALRDSGAKLACLCSSDKSYERDAASAAQALAAAGAKHIYLAGKPSEHRAAFEDAGIGTFLYQGCDALGLLRDAYERLGA
jgi:methylmalonyl-CoA mutase